jgi:L-ascorbate metabolism protein UlaG (beta-lactamase superfamily)
MRGSGLRGVVLNPAVSAMLALGIMPLAASMSAGGDGSETHGYGGQDSVTVTQLAVAGWMVRAHGQTLVIDALHRHGTQGPGAETLELLETARPPFDEIDLILVSHAHSDHFDAESVSRHMKHNPHAVVVSGRLVGDRLRQSPDFEQFSSRVIVVEPDPGEVVELEANGIPVEVFRLSHGERNNDYSMDNLGMVVDLAGTRIFNTGDITPVGQQEAYERALLNQERIDLAFLAFPLFEAVREGSPEAQAVIEEIVAPRHIIPSHLYEHHYGDLTDWIESRYPSAIVFRKGETRRLGAERERR